MTVHVDSFDDSPQVAISFAKDAAALPSTRYAFYCRVATDATHRVDLGARSRLVRLPDPANLPWVFDKSHFMIKESRCPCDFGPTMGRIECTCVRSIAELHGNESVQ